MFLLRPEKVVLEKVKMFSHSLSMSISESLESLLSQYSSTWFSSWSPAELDNFSLTGFHQDHGQKGSQTVFFFTDCLLSLIHVKGGCLVPGGFLSNRSLTYTFFCCCAPIPSCALGPSRPFEQLVEVGEMRYSKL